MKTNLISLFMMVIALPLCSANDGSKPASLEDRVASKEAKLRSLVEQLEKWEKATAIMQKNSMTQLESAEARLEEEQDEVAQLEVELGDLARAVEDLERTFARYKKSFYAIERANAVGEKIAILNTKDGRVYKQVVIQGFDPQAMSIMHQSGGRNVHFTMLPDELQQRFNFDPVEAEAFAKQDEAARKKFRSAHVANADQVVAANMQRSKEDYARHEAELAAMHERRRKEAAERRERTMARRAAEARSKEQASAMRAMKRAVEKPTSKNRGKAIVALGQHAPGMLPAFSAEMQASDDRRRRYDQERRERELRDRIWHLETHHGGSYSSGGWYSSGGR